MEAANIPVQLFSACNTQGDITPLWFRFENEEHRIKTIKIQKVYSKKEEKYCGLPYISYICLAAAEEKDHLIELRYSIGQHQWKLFRFLY